MYTGYCVVDLDFIPPFESGMLYLYSTKEQAYDLKESIYTDNKYDLVGYLAEVEINANLFNIYDKKNLYSLHKCLPKIIYTPYKKRVHKDVLISELYGINKDYEELAIGNTYEDTLDAHDNGVIVNLLKSFGYDGFICKDENIEAYMLFDAKHQTKVLNLFI